MSQIIKRSTGGGGGAVDSVNGTVDRITVTPNTGNVVVDIAATYVGQTSITTLGTVTTGTWQGTTVDELFGGTGQNTYNTGDILYASAPNTLSKLPIGAAGEVLTVNSGIPAWDPVPASGDTITGDSGPALTPDWTITGQQAGTVPVMFTNGTAPSALTVEDRTWITQFVVDPSATVGLRGTFTTIQAAVTAAVAGQAVFVRPGLYTENITLKAGVPITGLIPQGGAGEAVRIIGKIIDNGVALSTTLSRLALETNGDFILELTGASGDITLEDCYIDAQNNTAMSIGAGKRVIIQDCTGDLSTTGIAFWTGAGSALVTNTELTNSGASTTASSLSGGTFINRSSLSSPISSSGSANIRINTSTIDTSALNVTSITTAGTGTLEIKSSEALSGSATAISIGSGTTGTIENSVVNSTNASAIAGAGTLRYGSIVFQGTSSTMSVTTQTPLVHSNDAMKIVTPGAYPYTTVPQDAVILVDSAGGARTITPLASPTTGQRHVIKDASGNAAANNITVTPSGKNIDGSASFVMNVNYGSLTIVYNGAEWSIL